MEMTETDRARVVAAINAAETKTDGEIVCVLAACSTDTSALPLLVAALLALALPWALVAWTEMAVREMLVLQCVVFVVCGLVLSLPRLRIALVPRAARRAQAHRLAMDQFTARGLTRTKNRTGVLIFVSLAERYARIVADEGISARVPQRAWQEAVDELTAHMREGRIADGFVAAVERCGAVLAAHVPRTPGKRDQLPDRVYLI
jgi:putative membrane protein